LTKAVKWPNRDPINELGFQLLSHSGQTFNLEEERHPYTFLDNAPLADVDADGQAKARKCSKCGEAYRGSHRCPGAPDIDCSGYVPLRTATCDDCAGNSKTDLYPKKAYEVCKGFKRQFTGHPLQAEAACVAECLVEWEKKCRQRWRGCLDRNCCRLAAHIHCYVKCGFLPDFFNLPPGADVVGWNDLLPGCLARVADIPLGY